VGGSQADQRFQDEHVEGAWRDFAAVYHSLTRVAWLRE
jgi:hypothetical protein